MGMCEEIEELFTRYKELEDFHRTKEAEAKKMGKEDLAEFYHALASTEWWIHYNFLSSIVDKCKNGDLKGAYHDLLQLIDAVNRSVPFHVRKSRELSGYSGASHLVFASVDLNLKRFLEEIIRKYREYG